MNLLKATARPTEEENRQLYIININVDRILRNIIKTLALNHGFKTKKLSRFNTYILNTFRAFKMF
jgi:hypothetical protein